MTGLERFHGATQAWFAERFRAPTAVQLAGWEGIAGGHHTLMLAPTGSGKTLAAFLWCIDQLTHRPPPDPALRTRVVYISPIKALAYDVERNLRVPLAGIQAAGRGTLRDLTIDVRTGDTSPRERERQRKQPGDLLVTTPESLYLLLTSQSAARLAAVETVIVDEIHAVAPTKRGVHLALTLERLSALVSRSGRRDPQRIGLSATQRPLSEVARYLGGDRAVEVVDASSRPALDLEVTPIAVPDAASSETIYPRLLDAILTHRTTIIFVNARRTAERVAQQLADLATATARQPSDGELVRAHHGSVARAQRLEIEEALKAGRLRAIVATSSLELGIDMGTVDLVIQIESPGEVARGLQRIGRAGHHVGGVSRGRIIPKFRGDLLEAAVVARGMIAGDVEPIRIPDSALDVLAQQIVAMVAVEPWAVGDLAAVIRRAASYRGLSDGALAGVIDMLAGRYPSEEFGELRPRLAWDRQRDVLTARRGARLLSVVSGGTIPDRGLYAVHHGVDGPRIGELDEEMVNESRRGETFVLGATSWRIEDITRDRVIVSPAPGEPGKMPFWRGEGPGRPIELGRALGAFCRELAERAPGDLESLMASHRLDRAAAHAAIDYVAQQRAATGCVPSDRAITIERFRDELGDYRVCVLTPFGGRVHAPWALIVSRRLEDTLGYSVHALWNDDGIALRFADSDAVPSDDHLIPDPDDVERVLIDELARSTVFATHFRQNAARALLLPRRRPGLRTPLWVQRLRAHQLMGVALRYPAFPITLETYREVLRDVFDVPALIGLLRDLRSGAIAIDAVTTTAPSPFARSLVFDYVAAFLYQADAPLAERKAQALALDRGLLRELIGSESATLTAIDPALANALDDELQRRTPERRARDADELHDLVRQLGPLRRSELAERFAGTHDGVDNELDRGLATLLASGRATVAGDLWRDADDRLDSPLVARVRRYARSHGPFQLAAPAERFAVSERDLAAAARELAEAGELVAIGDQWCDGEVWRQLRRRALAALRAQIAPVAGSVFAGFLARWHGLDAPRRGPGALADALTKLEGVPLSFGELEARILPARVADYRPQMLDELGAAGHLVWIGAGALGSRDGRVVLAHRDRARQLAPAARPIEAPTVLHDAIAAHLEAAGASFLAAIESAVRTITGERAAIAAALWDLVWAGLVTNDTFAPLRSLAAVRRGGATRARRGGGHSFGGRWSLVAALGSEPTRAASAHAHARAALDRWGVASRGGARVDEVPVADFHDVLRAMEDAGTVRRGHFVDGLEGAQYAWPAAVDRLRAATTGAPVVVVVAATDPACAWGTVLAWPELADPAARPARRAGATAILVDGALAVWIEPKATRLATGRMARELVELAMVVGLPRLAARQRRRELRVELIDGISAATSPFSKALVAAGARLDYRGLVVAGVQNPVWGQPFAAGDHAAG